MNSRNSAITKLSLHKYASKLILNKPEYIDEFNEVDFDTEFTQEKYDLIFVFVFDLEQMNKYLRLIIEKNAINEKGYLFFAYPKKNNPKYNEYIERDSIFANISVDEEGYAYNSSLKFSRMVSLDEVFTVVGLKSDAKKKKKAATAKSSQRVDDYIDRIPDIMRYLESDVDVLERYRQLAPGYQKDWARYVYSAKRNETQEKRLLEMKAILAEGYKSIDLYRSRENK
ncbi:uncharacterized protein YdeI (YjbR/CyaY-like superfamily) [Fontibacillus solani]|uniref:Uncharacterized protein YdeI (YjbR/CyaY-like superfamily) n=1 Tax=Fontibacillus solani TaxID=1572857 RepID=A0A7W3STD0_9BACL|nr:YdeI/OmpD-associated family protein [Fontibacillus solani]MBA9085825.1 uncharacterized protein YdeI (YjbR/CyaY-like superfamily) [Fontibacillus solani]